MPRTSVSSQLQRIRDARARLEAEEKKLLARAQNGALSQIVEIAKAAGLTAEQVAAALGGQKRGRKPKADGAPVVAKRAKSKLAGKKVPPKYRNPANAKETWTGRGIAPKWAAELKAKGQLAKAAIA